MSSDQPPAEVSQGLNGFAKGDAIFDRGKYSSPKGVRKRNYRDFPYDYSLHGIDYGKYSKTVEALESSNDPSIMNPDNHKYGGLYGMDMKSGADTAGSYAYYAKRMGLKAPSFYRDGKGKFRVNAPVEEQRLIYREGYLPDNIKAMTHNPDEVTGVQQFTPTELYVGHRNGAGSVDNIMEAYSTNPDLPMSAVLKGVYKNPEFAKKVAEQNRLVGKTVGDDINRINNAFGMPIYNMSDGASASVYDRLEAGDYGEYRPGNMSDKIPLDDPRLYAKVANHPALQPEAPPAMSAEQAKQLKEAKTLSDFDELLKNLGTAQIGTSMMMPMAIPDPPKYPGVMPRQKPREEGGREFPKLTRELDGMRAPTREDPNPEMTAYMERIKRIAAGQQDLPGGGYNHGGVVGFKTGDKVFQPFTTIDGDTVESALEAAKINAEEERAAAIDAAAQFSSDSGYDYSPPSPVGRPTISVGNIIGGDTPRVGVGVPAPVKWGPTRHYTAADAPPPSPRRDPRDFMPTPVKRGGLEGLYDAVVGGSEKIHLTDDPVKTMKAGRQRLTDWANSNKDPTGWDKVGEFALAAPVGLIGLGGDAAIGIGEAYQGLDEWLNKPASQYAKDHPNNPALDPITDHVPGRPRSKGPAVLIDHSKDPLDPNAPAATPPSGGDETLTTRGGGGLADLSMEDAMSMAKRPMGKMESLLNNSIEKLLGPKPEDNMSEAIRRMQAGAAMMGYGGTLAMPHIAEGMKVYSDSLAAEKTSNQAEEYKNLALLGDAATLEGQRADKEYAGGIDIYVARLNAQAKVDAASIAKKAAAEMGAFVPSSAIAEAVKMAQFEFPELQDPMLVRSMDPKIREAKIELYRIQVRKNMRDIATTAIQNRIANVNKEPPTDIGQ
jgi:hypothetical protein